MTCDAPAHPSCAPAPAPLVSFFVSRRPSPVFGRRVVKAFNYRTVAWLKTACWNRPRSARWPFIAVASPSCCVATRCQKFFIMKKPSLFMNKAGRESGKRRLGLTQLQCDSLVSWNLIPKRLLPLGLFAPSTCGSNSPFPLIDAPERRTIYASSACRAVPCYCHLLVRHIVESRLKRPTTLRPLNT